MLTQIKIERPDEAEINELAKKMIEQNKVKMMNQVGLNPIGMVRVQMNHLGQLVTVQNSNPSNGNNAKKPQGGGLALDEESRKGRFGWTEIEKTFIPYIFKTSGTDGKFTGKFISVKMMETKILDKLIKILGPEVTKCTSINSYYITDHEAKLLNEINFKHADSQFGKDPFSTKDLVVNAGDAEQFYEYLELCHKKLILKRSQPSDRCGFFRINKEGVLPYTSNKNKIKKFIPLFYIEGLSEDLDLNVEKVEGWDLAYLKFCCKVQGIRHELISAKYCDVVALDDIKDLFSSGTTFEDYWPNKSCLELPKKTRQTTQQSSSSPAGAAAENWIQQPPVSSANQQPPVPFNQRKEKSVSKSNQSATVLKNNPANQIQQQEQMTQQLVRSATQKQSNSSTLSGSNR